MTRPNTRLDEGPSPEDIARFSDEAAHCPDCGASIWDQADICPKCYSYLAGHTASRDPVSRTFQKKWTVLVALIVLAGFLIMFIPGGLSLLRVIFPGSP